MDWLDLLAQKVDNLIYIYTFLKFTSLTVQVWVLVEA